MSDPNYLAWEREDAIWFDVKHIISKEVSVPCFPANFPALVHYLYSCFQDDSLNRNFCYRVGVSDTILFTHWKSTDCLFIFSDCFGNRRARNSLSVSLMPASWKKFTVLLSQYLDQGYKIQSFDMFNHIGRPVTFQIFLQYRDDNTIDWQQEGF